MPPKIEDADLLRTAGSRAAPDGDKRAETMKRCCELITEAFPGAAMVLLFVHNEQVSLLANVPPEMLRMFAAGLERRSHALEKELTNATDH